MLYRIGYILWGNQSSFVGWVGSILVFGSFVTVSCNDSIYNALCLLLDRWCTTKLNSGVYSSIQKSWQEFLPEYRWITGWALPRLSLLHHPELTMGHILWPVTHMTRDPWPSPRPWHESITILTTIAFFSAMMCNLKFRIAYSVNIFIVSPVVYTLYGNFYELNTVNSSLIFL